MVVIGINLFFISVYVHSLPDHWAVYLMVSVLVLMYIMFVIYLVSKIHVLLNQLGQIPKELFCDIFSICVKFCNVEQASFHSFRYIKKIVENKTYHRCEKKNMEVGSIPSSSTSFGQHLQPFTSTTLNTRILVLDAYINEKKSEIFLFKFAFICRFGFAWLPMDSNSLKECQ